MTYSICARDPATGELGMAVQTRWFAVGSVVGWAEPGVGVVATQSFTEIAHGPNGLAQLRAGRSASETVSALITADHGAAVRQLGIVDANGGSAAHTGGRCVAAAGHVTRPDVSCQANMMERPTVWPAMLEAFDGASGDLAERLLAALRAAEAEGGDVRGRQSAAMLVVPGPADDVRPWTRRFDLRVDDSRQPLAELTRLLGIARAYEALDEAADAARAGDLGRAFAASERAHRLAPDDDQITTFHALALMGAGRAAEAHETFATAAAVEPRSGEHLRRFVEAGQLGGAEAAVAALIGDAPR